MWPDPRTLPELSPHQQERVALAVSAVGPHAAHPPRIGLLTGSPGTGKTYAAAALIRAVVAREGESSIAVAAPTGKAAVRITAALASYGLPLKATTIHSLLKVATMDDPASASTAARTSGDGIQFQHGPGFPLPFRFVVVDEASMIDTGLMASFLSACSPDTSVLFVGDPNQLPPVGHGAPLRDFIAAGIPCGELTEIRRNAGTIVRACAAIRDGDRRLRAAARIDLAADDPANLFVSRARGPEMAARIVAAVDAAGMDGHDRVWEVQVLCAVNRRSPVSRRELNLLLQSHLNPRLAVSGNGGGSAGPFRLEDKVVCLKNGWLRVNRRDATGNGSGEALGGPKALDPGTAPTSDGKVFVANGELGRVVHIADGLFVARLESPTRCVVVPRGKSGSGGGGNGGGDGDDGRDPGRDGTGADDESTSGPAIDTGCQWDLGYALSCHKAQGSEWPVVVVALDDSGGARRVCSREWLYTAISRGKRLTILVGMQATAEEMISRPALGKRKTFLAERIGEAMGKDQGANHA